MTESGLLYRPQLNDQTLSGGQDVWVYRSSDDCELKLEPGTQVKIFDGSAMVEEAIDTWGLCRDLPEFSRLRDLEDRLSCEIQTKIIFEGAALAIID